MRLAHFGAGSSDLSDGNKILSGFSAADQIKSCGFTQAGNRNKRRKKLSVVRNQKPRSIGMIKVDRRKLQPAQVEFIHRFQRDEEIFLICREIGFAVEFIDFLRYRLSSSRRQIRLSDCADRSRHYRRQAAHAL